MTQSELRHIAEDLIDELRELPDGTEITSWQLLKLGGYDPEEYSEEDLVEYHQYLLKTAKANHITLDMSKHEFRLEGLPYNLDFIVRNRKAQIKCPRCGSTNTARILFGMPAFDKNMEEKINSGKLRLGGCCIYGVSDGKGGMINLTPYRYCNKCHKEFDRPAVLVANDKKSAEEYCDIVTGIRFSVNDYLLHSGFTEIEFKANQKGAKVSVFQIPCDKGSIPDRQITALRWMRLVNQLYTELYLEDWKKKYEDHSVLDGERWSLEIMFTNRRKRTYWGSNAYPPYWTELKALFRPYMRR